MLMVDLDGEISKNPVKTYYKTAMTVFVIRNTAQFVVKT